MNKKDILIQVEDYAKKFHAVDYWSGEVKSSAILDLAYESTANLEKIFGKDKQVWHIINDYAKKLHEVDYWSGKVKSSAILAPTYESLAKLEEVITNLEINPNLKRKM